jgi:hypothetical protein
VPEASSKKPEAVNIKLTLRQAQCPEVKEERKRRKPVKQAEK